MEQSTYIDTERTNRIVSIKIARVDTTDGRSVTPPVGGVTVVVGANNSGKSTFLREIFELLSEVNAGLPQTRRVVNALGVEKNGSGSDLTAWLTELGTYVDRGPQTGFKMPNSGLLPDFVLTGIWEGRQYPQLPSTVGPLAPLLAQYVNATNRVGGISPQQRRNDIAEPPQNPMQQLEDDPTLLDRVRAISNRIFRQDLTLDRLSNNVQLRVGIPDVSAPPVDAVTPEYRQSLISLEPLHEQGDGMTAVLGLLVPIICGFQSIALIDEPEAFLHPPQARTVGTILGELAQERNLQLFLATHDRNMLVGLLQSGAPVTVIRLERNKDHLRTHELDHEQVRKLWDDPVLRYSNLLDGLFHRAVVLCEAERDCTFYAASLDAMNEAAETPFPPGDILFVPSGGKDGFVSMINALAGVSVPVVVIPDIDILDDKSKIRTLVRSAGGDWASMERDYDVATESFRQPRRRFKNEHVLIAVRSVLEADPEGNYTREIEAAVKAAIRSDPSPWAELKRYGLAAFAGQAAQAASRLLDQMEKLGIAVVRDGELESLAPEVQSRKGLQWIREALAQRAFLGDRAQRHMKHVRAAIDSRLLGDQ